MFSYILSVSPPKIVTHDEVEQGNVHSEGEIVVIDDASDSSSTGSSAFLRYKLSNMKYNVSLSISYFLFKLLCTQYVEWWEYNNGGNK